MDNKVTITITAELNSIGIPTKIEMNNDVPILIRLLMLSEGFGMCIHLLNEADRDLTEQTTSIISQIIKTNK